MDQERNREELYAKAFNHGYYLQQFEPELAQKIAETPHTEDIYLQTFNDGREAYLQEMKERLNEKTYSTPKHFQDKGRERDR